MRILITGGRTPFALHLSRLFHVAGHEVTVTDSQRQSIARFTKFKTRFVQTANARFQRQQFEQDLLRLIGKVQPDLILPSCEELFYVGSLLERVGWEGDYFGPRTDLAMQVHNKAQFAEMASALGYAPAQNLVLTDRQDVAGFAGDPRNFVFKPIYSRFASRVLVGPDPTALDAIAPTVEDPWLAQSKITGTEICAYAVIRHGKVCAVAPYRNLMKVGQGTSIVFESTPSPDIEEFVHAFAAKTGWHGQISFDFIRQADGRLVVIEANPRATMGVNLFLPDDGLVEAILGQTDQARPSRRLTAIKGTVWLVGMLGMLGFTPRQAWWNYLTKADDSFKFPGEGPLWNGQTKSVNEYFALAKQKKISVLEATTYDMEWNGEPLGDVEWDSASARADAAQ